MGKEAHEGSARLAGNVKDGSRREALRRFGRYAAAAPVAMVLLHPKKGGAVPDAYNDEAQKKEPQ